MVGLDRKFGTRSNNIAIRTLFIVEFVPANIYGSLDQPAVKSAP